MSAAGSARKKVLVCGATGFIGRNMAERLAADPSYDVTCLYHRERADTELPRIEGARWVRADLRQADPAARALEGQDIVIHAAATTSGSRDIVNQPYLHVTDNAVMNSLLFRAAHERGVGQVVFFSCAVMYPTGRPAPVKEDDFDPEAIPPNYFGVGWTKVYTEKMAEFYARLGKTRFTVIRHSNIYGPYDKFDLERSHVFGATVTKVLRAEGGKITVWGDGSEGRDLLYVSDLCDFVETALRADAPAYDLVNVGYGSATPIRALVEKVIAASGRELAIEHDLSKPSIKTTVALDCAKALRAYGWKPRTSLEEGIRKTLEWHRANLS